jgi:MoaA/NifB/PqqE/SkfB family radical SAM enzyme
MVIDKKIYPIKEVFCTTPYSMIMINPDGGYRLCCLTNSLRHDLGAAIDPDTGAEMNVWTHSFAQAMNGKWHIEMRKAHQEGRRTEQCSCCYDRDDIKGSSRRTYVTEELGRVIPEFVQSENAANVMDLTTHKLNIPPVSLDLRFSNLCNLKCYHCGPWYSDKWYEEFADFNKVDNFGWNGKRIKISEATKGRLGANENGDLWWESEIWWERFDELAPSLRHLYVTGGEPMLVPAHAEMLQRLVDKGYAKDVVVELDTNLTALNPKIMSLWSNFKQVDVRVSVDAVDRLYEIARFPGKWDKFKSNIADLQAGKGPNMNVWLTSCISPLSVFQLQATEEFNAEMGISRNVHYRYIEGPDYLALGLLTKKQKQFIIDFYEKNPTRYAKTLVEYLRIHWENCDKKALRRFVEFMDYLDKSRGTDWRKESPLTSEMFKPEMLED